MPTEFPPIQELMPHAGEMVLLSEVLAHSGDATECAVEVGRDLLHWNTGASVPAWVGVELMSQCIAVHGGLLGRASGTPPRIGFLLGSRRIQFTGTDFAPEQTLTVRARRVWGQEVGMVSFDCEIEDAASGAPMLKGRLNCFVPSDADLGDAQFHGDER